MSYEEKPETIAFILSQLQSALEQHHRQELALNGQVIQMFGGSTLATALFGLSFSLEHLDVLTAIVYSAGFIVYFIASFLTFRNLAINISQSWSQAVLLSSESHQKYVPELSQELISEVKGAYSHNVAVLDVKLRGKTLLICAVVVQFQLFIFGALMDFFALVGSRVGGPSLSEHLPGATLGIGFVLATIFSLNAFVFRSVSKNVTRLFIAVAILCLISMLIHVYLTLA